MRAVTFQHTGLVQVDTVSDPVIEHPRDAIVKISSTAICGSDLHMYDGFIPAVKPGDILGQEFMGEIVDTGAEVTNLAKGDRVVVPFHISCGTCPFCADQQYTLCDMSNRKPEMLEKAYGQATGGLFGYSHLYGGYPGGQAEYVRVPERLALAASLGAEPINEGEDKVYDVLKDKTDGRLPGCCIDAVGLKAQGASLLGQLLDQFKVPTSQETDRPNALRAAIYCCRKGGTVSIPGVYGGIVDKFPIGVAFGKALTFRMGQTHALKFIRPLLEKIEQGKIDPSFLITHRVGLDAAPKMYETFRDKKDDCVKVVMSP